MGIAATQSKQRWNASHYTQVKISVNPDIASDFKSACATTNASMASVLSKFMTEYSKAVIENKFPSDLSTRRKRRTAIKTLILQLERIMAAEERCRDNIPSNLQGSVVFDTADQYVSSLEETMELLHSIY